MKLHTDEALKGTAKDGIEAPDIPNDTALRAYQGRPGDISFSDAFAAALLFSVFSNFRVFLK